MKDICRICAVDASYFESKSSFIDVILLKRRNAIAHGEETYISYAELDDVISEGVALMRTFKDVLQNKIYSKTYMAA